MKRIYYCKALKKTGKPIVVVDDKGKSTTTNLIEGYGHYRVAFNNATGKAKASGATTILEVWE